MSSETGFDPALYDRFPTSDPRPADERAELDRIWAAPSGIARVTAINNNYIGYWFIATAFLFFLLAGVLALIMRVQLAQPLAGLVPADTYNQVFTMHGTVMMFLFAVPMMEALGVLLLPQMLGARELPFPRLSAYAFWAYAIGGLSFFASLFVGLAPDGGWFMYPPYTNRIYSPGINVDFWLLGIGFIEISAIAGAIEIIVGVLRTRSPNMTLREMPIFAWGMLVFAVMIIMAFPAVIVCSLLLELERAFNWPFFDATRGGDPMLWQHLFWFFGHPEVYIIFLPASALVSMMIPALARTRLVGHDLIVFAFLATGFISFGVWAHHMFTTGIPALSAGFFASASMSVSVPAGIQVFAWIATFASGRPVFNTPTLFVLGGLFTFVLGGLTGVMVAMVPFDWQTHDTYFIVAHLHYVLIGGMVFPLFAVFWFWSGMVSRRPLSERVGRWVFWLIFAGMQITFLPMHLTGLSGMPRRVYTYLPQHGWGGLNLISTIGAFVLAAGVLLFLVEVARNFRFTVGASAGNIYGAGTLEWLPAGLYSSRSLPVVRSRYPLWDDPGLPDAVDSGRHVLPGAPTGRRESLITSTFRAEPMYLQIVPGPSVWPLAAAVFTAGFFLILTVQAYTIAFISGVLAVAAMLRWLWDLDRPVEKAEVDIGAGIKVPTYVTGPTSHGWWAMVILLVVIFMMFLMTAFAFLFLYGVHPEFWRGGPERGWLAAIVAGHGIGLGLALRGRQLQARPDAGRWSPVLVLLCGIAATTAATGLDIMAWRSSGLGPEASGQGATVYGFLALQGQVVAVALLMGLYLAARNARGLITRPRNATLDLVTLFTAYIAAQGIGSALLTHLLTGG